MNERKTVKLVVDNVAQQNARDFWQQFDNMQEKINNLQSKIDKAIDYLYEHSQYNDRDGVRYIKEDEYCVDYLLDILKEDK